MIRFPRRRRTPDPDLPPPHVIAVAATAARLADELEDGDTVLGVSIQVMSSGQLRVYAIRGDTRDVHRSVCTDPGAFHRAAEAFGEAFTDATVPEVLP